MTLVVKFGISYFNSSKFQTLDLIVGLNIFTGEDFVELAITPYDGRYAEIFDKKVEIPKFE